jgi:hypothetical protein
MSIGCEGDGVEVGGWVPQVAGKAAKAYNPEFGLVLETGVWYK